MYHIRFCIILFNAVTGSGLEVSEIGDEYVKRDSIHECDNNLMHRVCRSKGKLISETDIYRDFFSKHGTSSFIFILEFPI
jgi:hypothetical protein